MKKKTFVSLLVQSLICIFLLELLLRVVFYQQTGRDHFAIVETARNIKRKFTKPDNERIYHDFLLARPDSSQEVNRLIATEAFASNHFEYTPWTEYKNIDFAGKYINTKGLVRSSVPAAFFNPDTTGKLNIYFFGGSTMYGVNVTDRETIASAFVNLYKKKFPHGASINVTNYGLPAAYSYHELMLLSHLIYAGKTPGMAIVLDGLNDFMMPAGVLQRLPYYYYRLQQASKDKLNLKMLEDINDSTQVLFEYPPDMSEDKLKDTLVSNYLSNLAHMKALAAVNNFDAFFFIQPNPFFNYPNKKNDPICQQYPFPLVTKAYSVLEQKSTKISNCVFLGNMLVAEKGYPFIDRFHYSPAMCTKIAEQILSTVGHKINSR